MRSLEFKYVTVTSNKNKEEGTLGYFWWANYFTPKDLTYLFVLYHWLYHPFIKGGYTLSLTSGKKILTTLLDYDTSICYYLKQLSISKLQLILVFIRFSEI